MKKRILKIFIGLIVAILLIFAWVIAKVYSQSNIDEAQNVDAIVVLGASQWNGKPSPVFKARLDQALVLYNKNLASNIILTGGIGKGEVISESLVGKNYLMEKGINDQNIFIEEISHTSLQNLKEVVKILKEQNLKSVILVSDGFHMMRLKKMTKDLGIEYYASPAKASPIKQNGLTEFKYAIRESLVYLMYLLFKI